MPECLYYASETTSRQVQVDVSCLLLLFSIFYPHVCCCYLLVSLGLLRKCTYRCVYIHLMCTITTLFIYMIVDDKEDAKEEDSSRYGCD